MFCETSFSYMNNLTSTSNTASRINLVLKIGKCRKITSQKASKGKTKRAILKVSHWSNRTLTYRNDLELTHRNFFSSGHDRVLWKKTQSVFTNCQNDTRKIYRWHKYYRTLSQPDKYWKLTKYFFNR